MRLSRRCIQSTYVHCNYHRRFNNGSNGWTNVIHLVFRYIQIEHRDSNLGSKNKITQTMKLNSYSKFALMMLVSFFMMYGIMFLNADKFSHVMLSTTRTYMTLLMIAPMAISMLLFMWGMYDNKRLNFAIITGAALVFMGTLSMLRHQTLIKDVQYMKAMIPHHSSAIMVSESATFKDPETAELAKEIIKAQKKEIAQMKEIIRRLESK